MENVWDAAFDEQQSEEEEKVEVPSDIVSDDLSILLNLGRLTSTFDFLGYRFTIKTLKMNEELQASDIASRYSSNLDQGTRAYIAAIVAGCIDTVNDAPLVRSIGPNDSSIIDRKFNYILDNYYWFVVEHIYEKYAELLKRLEVALEEFKKK